MFSPRLPQVFQDIDQPWHRLPRSLQGAECFQLSPITVNGSFIDTKGTLQSGVLR